MRQHNAENERVKREYLIYLKAAKGLSEHSGDPDQPFQAIPITHSDRSRSVWRGVREGAVGCIS